MAPYGHQDPSGGFPTCLCVPWPRATSELGGQHATPGRGGGQEGPGEPDLLFDLLSLKAGAGAGGGPGGKGLGFSPPRVHPSLGGVTRSRFSHVSACEFQWVTNPFGTSFSHPCEEGIVRPISQGHCRDQTKTL